MWQVPYWRYILFFKTLWNFERLWCILYFLILLVHFYSDCCNGLNKFSVGAKVTIYAWLSLFTSLGFFFSIKLNCNMRKSRISFTNLLTLNWILNLPLICFRQTFWMTPAAFKYCSKYLSSRLWHVKSSITYVNYQHFDSRKFVLND